MCVFTHNFRNMSAAMMWRDGCVSKGRHNSPEDRTPATMRDHFITMNMHGDSLLNELNTQDDIIMSSMVDELSHQASKRT